jgi:hypothetical protein
MLLRMLAGLAAAKVLEGPPDFVEWPGAANYATTKVPRLQAGNVACLIRALLDLNTKHSGREFDESSQTVERIRTIVALRGYAEGETDPQVVGEMWLLQDTLIAAGEYEEAQEVERDAYRRMEKYIQDIPIDSL